jgi:hypothetical protein
MVRFARLRQTFEIAAGEFSDAQSVLYCEIQPTPALPAYVECFWLLEGEAGSEGAADCQNAHGAEIMSV